MSKTALIMGASGGIGEACVRALAESGWNVICHGYQRVKKILNFVEELRSTYRSQDFFVVSLNMRNESGIDSFLAELFAVDAVVFASGFSVYKFVAEHTPQEMEALWQIHLKTPMLLLRALEEKLSRSRAGRVVFLGSIYGELGSSMEAVYSAMKGAQVAFAKSYAKEVATKGITVNVVAPGAVATRMNESWTEEELIELREKIPLGRLAAPSEIARVVDFLVSDQASYITGSTFDVNGGWGL